MPSPPARNEARSTRTVGWVVIAVAFALMTAFAGYLIQDSMDVDPRDPGWGDIAYVFGPILAAGAAFVTGVLLLAVAALRLVSVRASEAAVAVAVGVVVAPVLFVVLLIATAIALDATESSLVMGIAAFLAPVLIGVATVLVTCQWRPHREAPDRSATG